MIMCKADFRIAEACWPGDRATVEALFREYVASLAEDIETSYVSALRDLGCDIAQGYHLGRPTSVVEASALVTDAAAAVAVPVSAS